MPNTFGGKSYKKTKSRNVRRRNKNPDLPVDTSTGIDFYAIIQKRLGTNRLSVKLDNGNEIQAVIPGKFMKRVWFKAGDYIQVRRTGDNFYDVIQKIVNHNEQDNAQTALGKREAGEKNIFRPSLSDEDSEEDNNFNDFNNNSDIEDFDEFGNKIVSKKDNKNDLDEYSNDDNDNDEQDKNNKSNEIIYKQTIKIEKIKRKQKEKERELQRRNIEKDNDIYLKPTSLIENNSSSSSDSD
jgi:initiation factor 1A